MMPLQEALSAMKDLGFDGIELMIGNPASFDAETFERQVKDHGLSTSQICTGELFGSYGLALNHPDVSLRSAAMRSAEDVIRMAGRWQCTVGIGRFRGKVWDSDPGVSMGRMADSLRHLNKVAEDEGVDILLEPLRRDVCDTLNTVAETASVIQAWRLDRFGWLLDTDHVDLGQTESIRREVRSLGFVHLADSRHMPLGRGDIRFEDYIALFASLGYQGYCSVEVFPDPSIKDELLLEEMAERLSEYFRKANVRKEESHAD
jgi:sugar phosphate isomerase/epimerase